MTAPLRLTIPHGVDEPAASLLSRLAARNGIDLAAEFCRDVGLGFREVVDGDPDALRSLAAMAGVDPTALVASTFASEANRGYVVGGNRIPFRGIDRGTTRICPACLLEDAANSDLPPEIAMHARFWWEASIVGTCPAHDLPLACVASGRRPTVHDLVADLRPVRDALAPLLASLAPRPATRPERYLVARLAGRRPDGPVPFLDALPAFHGARFCEVIGAIRIHGRGTPLGTLDEGDRLAAGEAGFDVAIGGGDAVRSFVVDMVRDRPRDRSFNASATFVLGGLSAWLYRNKGNPDLLPLRRFLADIVVEHLPLGPGDTCLGLPVDRRVLHSVHTASKECGVHHIRLRKALVENGFIVERQPRVPDNFMTFRSGPAATFLATLADTMSLGEAQRYIGAPRLHGQLLFRSGFLKPVGHRETRRKGMLAFSRDHLDRFMADLTRDARDVEDPAALPIIQAAKRVPCGSMDIVRLLLERRLPWVGRSGGAQGYLSILVRPDDVRAILVPEGLTLLIKDFAEAAGAPVDRIRRLVREGFLEATLIRREIGGRRGYAIPRTQLDRLAAHGTDLIGLRELAGAWGVQEQRAAYVIRGCGIPEVRNPIESLRRFYRRGDIASNAELRTRKLFLPG